MPEEEWGDLFVVYDNMCQLNRLLAARNELPLEAPYNRMWLRVSKIIDGLHVANHKNGACRRDYGPDHFSQRFGEQFAKNTMVAEQTFSWLGKFRKQANSMTKENQIFFFHRLIVLRNRYIE